MIIIKLENLKIGMILKNYKELCKVLEVKPLSGNSKKAQMKWFSQHFILEQQGYGFIVKKIITNEVQPKPTRGGANNSIEYKENMERLILDILAQNNNKGEIFLSKNKFFYALEMVNVNYLDTYKRIDKWSKYLDVDEYTMQEWMDTTGGVLERSLESALTSLRNKALVIWSKEMTICKLEEIKGSEIVRQEIIKDKHGEEKTRHIIEKATRPVTKEADDEEKKQVLKTEKEVLDQLGCIDKREVIRKGLWRDFKAKVEYILINKYKIKYYFQSYKILSNPEHIQVEFRKRYLLDSDSRNEEKIITNSSVLDRLENNALSRYANAIKQLEDNDIIFYQNEKIENRANDNYIDKNIKLNKAFIDRNAPDIRNDVKKVKIS